MYKNEDGTFSKETLLKMWPQAAGELRGFRIALERRAGITADQLGMALQLAEAEFNRLKDEQTPQTINENKKGASKKLKKGDFVFITNKAASDLPHLKKIMWKGGVIEKIHGEIADVRVTNIEFVNVSLLTTSDDAYDPIP